MKLVIHSVEGSLGRTGAIVVCPAPDARVQGRNESRLVTPAMGVDKFLHSFQMTLLRLEAWLEDGLVAPFAVMLANCELPDSEAKEVKTCAAFVLVECVRDAGFAGFEGQPHFSQPFFGQAACGLECSQVFAENDEIVCETDDGQSVSLG